MHLKLLVRGKKFLVLVRMDFKFEFFHFGLDSEKNAPGSHPWMTAIP